MSSPVGTSHTIPASSSSSRLASTGRVKMVDLSDDFTTQRCSTPSPTNRYDNRDGCLYQRLGSSMQRHKDGGEVEHQRIHLPYQLPGTESSIPGNSGFYQGRSPNTKAFETVDRQHNRGGVHQQERRYAISTPSDSSNGDLDILSITPDMDHSKASSRFNEFRSRLCIPEFRQSHRVDVRSHYLSTNYNSILHTGSGPFGNVLESPGSPVCSTLSRSRSSGDRRLLARLESLDSIYSPPIILIPKILMQMKQDKATGLLVAPHWHGQPWFPNLKGMLVDYPARLPALPTTIFLPFAPEESRLETAGLPEEVCQVIMASWRESTQQRYEVPWKVWTSWCVQRQKCPFSAPVNDILTFLAEQFNSRDLAYRTIAVYKACISQLHDPIEGRQLGNLPLVPRFMKGIFELRPPQPKLCSIWPVSKVLLHFAGREPLEGLSLKDLTLKLTILLALTSAARAHELAALNLTSALIKQDVCEFTIPIHVKNARPYHPPRKIVLTRYNKNSAICVVRCLNQYEFGHFTSHRRAESGSSHEPNSSQAKTSFKHYFNC